MLFRSAGHWLRPFHHLVKRVVDGALGALVPPDTLSFAEGSDQASYLFEEETAMLEYVRWLASRV